MYIQSFLDDDCYKLKTCYAISELYPKAHASFCFINRGKDKFNDNFKEVFIHMLNREMPKISVTRDEITWLSHQFPEIKNSFWSWLDNYRYNPGEVEVIFKDDNMLIYIDGLWQRVTLWEVKLLSIISEAYFRTLPGWDSSGYIERVLEKRRFLKEHPDIKVTEFGTRRRASFKTQEDVVGTLAPFLNGTSNMLLAKNHGLDLKGTMPHEWIMGVSALESLRFANKFALNKWAKVWPSPGIALSDTFGTDPFLRDFDISLSKLYDGTRQDSGNPRIYANRIIMHYQIKGINPLHKTIIFSDSLNFDKIYKIHNVYKNSINCEYGVGTFLTNDFETSQPLNIVIKLMGIDKFPVVKISDDEGKECGEQRAVEAMKWITRI